MNMIKDFSPATVLSWSRLYMKGNLSGRVTMRKYYGSLEEKRDVNFTSISNTFVNICRFIVC